MGSSLQWLLLLQSPGFRHMDSVVVTYGPSCPKACGIFPDQRSNSCLMSPALAGGFLTTGPPGKCLYILLLAIYNCELGNRNSAKYMDLLHSVALAPLAAHRGSWDKGKLQKAAGMTVWSVKWQKKYRNSVLLRG